VSFPLNPSEGTVWMNPANNVSFKFTTGFWKILPIAQQGNTINIVKDTKPDLTIKSGNIDGRPLIKVNGQYEKIVLRDELGEQTNQNSLEINAGYF